MRRILWTGGFDSTWLLIDALLAGHRVEALTYRSAYIGEHGWQKAANEDEARRRITHALHKLSPSLRSHLGIAVLDPPGWRLPHDVFHEPWHRLREHAPFNAVRYAALVYGDDGTRKFETHRLWPDQDWLVGAIPALWAAHGLEAAYVAGDSLTRPALAWRAAALRSLGISMPLLSHTKQDLLADAHKRGFAHLLDLTWSCEALGSEKREKPCGKCTPCRLRIVASHGRA